MTSNFSYSTYTWQCPAAGCCFSACLKHVGIFALLLMKFQCHVKRAHTGFLKRLLKRIHQFFHLPNLGCLSRMLSRPLHLEQLSRFSKLFFPFKSSAQGDELLQHRPGFLEEQEPSLRYQEPSLQVSASHQLWDLRQAVYFLQLSSFSSLKSLLKNWKKIMKNKYCIPVSTSLTKLL